MADDKQNPDSGAPPPPPANVLIAACLFEGALVILAMAAGWLFGIDPFALARADYNALITGVIATLPMLLMLFWGLRRPESVLGQVTQQAGHVVSQIFAKTSVPGLLLVSLLAGLGEEAFFRGFLQPLISGWTNELTGLLIAAAVFGLAHALSAAYAIVAAVIGLYLGALFLYTDNLMVPVVAHAFYDFIALLGIRNRTR